MPREPCAAALNQRRRRRPPRHAVHFEEHVRFALRTSAQRRLDLARQDPRAAQVAHHLARRVASERALPARARARTGRSRGTRSIQSTQAIARELRPRSRGHAVVVERVDVGGQVDRRTSRVRRATSSERRRARTPRTSARPESLRALRGHARVGDHDERCEPLQSEPDSLLFGLAGEVSVGSAVAHRLHAAHLGVDLAPREHFGRRDGSASCVLQACSAARRRCTCSGCSARAVVRARPGRAGGRRASTWTDPAWRRPPGLRRAPPAHDELPARVLHRAKRPFSAKLYGRSSHFAAHQAASGRAPVDRAELAVLVGGTRMPSRSQTVGRTSISSVIAFTRTPAGKRSGQRITSGTRRFVCTMWSCSHSSCPKAAFAERLAVVRR